VEPAEAKAGYGLHNKILSEMRGVLKDGAELGYKMEDIPKPDLVNLMNLFIVWGVSIQKKSGLTAWGTTKCLNQANLPIIIGK